MELYEIEKKDNLLTIKSTKKLYTFDADKIEYFSCLKERRKFIPIFIKRFPIIIHDRKKGNYGSLIVGIIENEFNIEKHNKKSHCKIIKKIKIKNIKNLDKILNTISKNKYGKIIDFAYSKYTEFSKATKNGYEDGIEVK